jgi:hypothetical protein
MTGDRIELLERRVRVLSIAVVVLTAAFVVDLLVLCLPASVRALLAIWTLAAIPFIGFLLIGGLMTLLMIHRQIPAIAREVGSWFAPLRRSHR